MQPGHDVEVGHQRAQLGGGAEIELGALVDIERLVEIVGLHPQHVGVGPTLHQREAVHHFGRIAFFQQLPGRQACRPGAGRVAQFAQQAGDVALHRRIERAGHRQVQSIEVVEVEIAAAAPRRSAAAHQPRQIGAHRIGGLLADKRDGRSRHAGSAPVQPDLQGRVPQRGRNHAGAAEQAQMAVGQLLQLGLIDIKVVGRAALRNQQAEGLLVELCLRAGRVAFVGGVIRGLRVFQDAVDVPEIAAIPDPEPIAQSMHFAKPGLGRQGHGVDVAQHDLAPHRTGVLALLVGAQAGRHHLLQLFPDRGGASVGGVLVLLDLGRQRAATGRTPVAAEGAAGLGQHGVGQPVPFHRRVAFGVLAVQQFAVFDIEQALHQNRRNVFKALKHPLRVALLEQAVVAAIKDAQAALGFFGVGGKVPGIDNPRHARRDLRLLHDPEILRLQPLQEQRQPGIAEPIIKRRT